MSNLNVDYAYLNFFQSNTDNYELIPAEQEEYRNKPFLSNMSDWQLAVARFKIPLSALPLFVFDDNKLDPANPGYESTYKFSFGIGNAFGTPLEQQLIFESRTPNELTFPENRFVYYISHMLDMMNEALRSLWNTAIANATYQAIIPDSLETEAFAPWIELDEATKLLKLNLPVTDPTAGTPECPFFNDNPLNIRLAMSPKLYNFLIGFPVFGYNRTAGSLPGIGQDPDRMYEFDFTMRNNRPDARDIITQNRFQDKTVTNWFVQLRQDFSSLYAFSSLSRIIITTNLPVAAEFLTVKGSNGENITQTLLTDFEVPALDAEQKNYIQFFPQGELRWYNFTSNGPLSRSSLRIFFQTRDLETIPLRVPPSFDSALKLMFRRRIGKQLLTYSHGNINQGSLH